MGLRSPSRTRLGYSRKELSDLLHALHVHERVAADSLDRLPRLPERPARRLRSRPCTWYWYKDPADIPERHWQRYGLTRSEGGADVG